MVEGGLGIHSDTEQIRSNPHTNGLLSAGCTQSQINQTAKLVATAGKTWLRPSSKYGSIPSPDSTQEEMEGKGDAINYQTLIDRLILQDKQ